MLRLTKRTDEATTRPPVPAQSKGRPRVEAALIAGSGVGAGAGAPKLDWIRAAPDDDLRAVDLQDRRCRGQPYTRRETERGSYAT